MRKIDPEVHAEKRRQILDAASICFAEKGFEATRTADICQKAGISSGKLFHYFKNKRDVFTAIFAQGKSEDTARLDEASRAPTTVAALVGFFEEALSHQGNPVLAGLLFEAIAFARRDAEFAQALERDELHTRDQLVALVETAIAKGEVAPGTDPLQAADWLMGLHDLTILRAVWDRKQAPGTDRSMIETLVRSILSASQRQPGTSGENS